MSGRSIEVYPEEANEAGIFSEEALLIVGIDFALLIHLHEDAFLVDGNDRRAHLDLEGHGCVFIRCIFRRSRSCGLSRLPA